MRWRCARGGGEGCLWLSRASGLPSPQPSARQDLATFLERSRKEKDERIVMFVSQLEERMHGSQAPAPVS